jgi:L-lactate permease
LSRPQGRPQNLVRSEVTNRLRRAQRPTPNAQRPTPNVQQKLRAWLPWILLSVFVAVWKIAPIENCLNAAAPWKFEMPALNFAVQKMPPVVAAPELEKAIYKFNILAMTGTALFLAGIVSGLLLGLKPAALARLYGRCIWRVRTSLLTISLMLALGFTTRFSGTDSTLGLALAALVGVLVLLQARVLSWTIPHSHEKLPPRFPQHRRLCKRAAARPGYCAARTLTPAFASFMPERSTAGSEPGSPSGALTISTFAPTPTVL